jgi:excisionase family DNA binding protein
MNKPLTIAEFADRAQVSRDTIERMIKLGKLKAERKNPVAGRTSPLLIPAEEWTRWKKLQSGKA